MACIVQGWCPICTALPKDLDNPDGAVPRSHAHTNLAHNAFDPKVLWDDYGIIHDCMVSSDRSTFHFFDNRPSLTPRFSAVHCSIPRLRYP